MGRCATMARRDLRPASASYISQILRPNVPIKQFTWLFTRLWTHRVEQHELYELAQHVQLRGNYLGIYRRQMPPWTNVSVTQHRFGHCHNPGRYESSIAWHLVCGVRCLVFGVWCLVFGVWCLVFGVWCLVFGVWRLAFGVWRLAFGVWRLAFGVWRHNT